MKNVFKALASLLLLFVLSCSLLAQSGTSRLSGVVSDENGAALEGAKVTLTNEATGVSATQITTSGGVYSFASIAPGKYTITVEQSGFKKNVRTGNVVEVDTPSNVDIPLEIGNVSETVTVQAEGITVQSNTATIGNVVDQRTIENLPLNGRNPLALVLLEPGVVQRSFGGVGSGVHINGSRDRAYNVTIDGIDANESSVPNPVSNLYRLNPDNVQEFKVTTNNATANEGRNSGASISLSTRAGGDSFHGTGFWFIRNDALNSTEWFTNALAQPKRDTKLHQYGFELGGPIIKQKTFFFGSYQFNRVNFTQPIDQTFGVPIVYTGAARSGNFRYFRPDPANPLVINGVTITRNSPLLVDPNTGALRSDVPMCTSDTQLRCVFVYNLVTRGPAGTALNSFVGNYLNTLPRPNNFTFGDGLNTAGFLWNPPTSIRGPAYNFRVDHNFTSNHSVFGRYLYSDYNTLEGDPLNSRPQIFPGFAPLGEVYRKTSNLVLGYRWNVSSYITNDFRFGYSKFNFLFTQGEANPDFPNISPIDFNGITEPYNNTPRTQREVFTPQFVDDLTIVRGNHVIGVGLNFRFYRHRDVRGQPGGINVTPAISMDTSIRALPAAWLAGGPNAPPGLTTGTDYTFYQNFVANQIGRPARISQTFIADLANNVFLPFIDGSGNVSLFDVTTLANQYNLYVQDEWKARRNLTLNLGLRWEYNPPAHTKDGKTFVADTPILAGPTTFRPADGWYENEKYGVFGPSLGLVWSPEYKNGFLKSIFGESGQSAIRLGYRIAYDTISTFQVTAAAGRVPGLLVTCSVVPGVAPAPSTGCPSVSDTAALGSGFPLQLPPPTLQPSSFLRLPSVLNNVAPPITVFAPKMKAPLVHQWSLSWQRELPLKLVAQVAYVGRRGTHLFYARNMNQINGDGIMPDFLIMQQNMRNGCQPSGVGSLPGRTCTNPNTNISVITSGVMSVATVNGFSSSLISPGLLAIINPATQAVIASAIPAQNSVGGFAVQVENRTLNYRLRPNQQFSTITYLDNSGDSNYHAAQFTLRRRFGAGLGLAAAYTFAKSIDNQSVDPVGAASGGGLSTTTSRAPVDARNLSIEKARSDFDRRHVFTMSAVWDVPIGRGRYLFSDAPGWLNQVIGGWTINGISTYMTGEPFSIRSNSFTSNGGHDSRADLIDPSVRARLTFLPGIPGPVLFENANAFAVPAPLGNGAGRNIFKSPYYYNLDIGIVKTFSITERIKFDLRTEMFNVLNRVNFDNPRDASVGSPNFQSALFAQTCCQGVAPPSTQTIIQTGESARVIQFAMKLKF